MHRTAPPRHSNGRRHVAVTTANPSATAATAASFQSALLAALMHQMEHCHHYSLDLPSLVADLE